jgi:phosphatidylglycerophosphate synthase
MSTESEVRASYADNRYRPVEEELLFRPLSRPIARLLAGYGVSPTAVNFIGCAATGAAALIIGSGVTGLWGALAIYLAFLIDKVDGDLARARNVASPRGQYTDGFLDLIGEVSLTIGALYAVGYVHPVLVALSIAGPLLFYYHGVSVPFYLNKLAPDHRAPHRASGWRTLFGYGRAKHFLFMALLALIGRLDLAFYVLPLLVPYTAILFMRNVLRRP